MVDPKASVTGARLSVLRNPKYEAWLAKQIRPLGETANLVRDEIMNTIECWHEDGGSIKARRLKPKRGCRGVIPTKPKVVTLDTERMEWRCELVVYDVGGKPVMLDHGVALVPVEDCFR